MAMTTLYPDCRLKDSSTNQLILEIKIQNLKSKIQLTEKAVLFSVDLLRTNLRSLVPKLENGAR